MAKNIVICADGTGNTVLRGRGTNVFKLFEAVDIHGHRMDPEVPEQVAFYTDGVGTEGNRYLRALGAAFGFGLKRNVLRLYSDLVLSYEPGDRVFMFGFSRGAFTVRTLAGFVAAFGVTKLDGTGGDRDALTRRAKVAYHLYGARTPATLQRLAPWPRGRRAPGEELTEMREAYCHHPVPIEFLGVWDTVAALGFPVESLATFWDRRVYRFKLDDERIPSNVVCARHALSIDDERLSFHPTMWDPSSHSDVRQVWFAGVHSNVGGGYPKQGMSLVSLDWMMTAAETRGLRFIESIRKQYREAQNVHDHHYDSRAGLNAYYRYAPREIGNLCERTNAPVCVHESVLDRIRLGTQYYAPGNLPHRFEIDPYDASRPATPGAEGLLSAIERDVDGAEMLKAARAWITLRKSCYWGMVFLSALIALEAALDIWSGAGSSIITAGSDLLETLRSSVFGWTGIRLVLDALTELVADAVAFVMGGEALSTVVQEAIRSGLSLAFVAFVFYSIAGFARDRVQRQFRRRWFRRVMGSVRRAA